jgi:hypothetical protein
LEEIESGVSSGLASNTPEEPEHETVVIETPDVERPTTRTKKRNRVPVDVYDALEFTTQLGEQATRDHRNGPRGAWLARNAIRGLLETRTPPTDPQTVDTLHWFLAVRRPRRPRR